MGQVGWVAWLLLASCTGPEREPSPLLDVPNQESWAISGMSGGAYVVRTESNVPHIYASNRADLVRVSGFVQARDRFFEMDMARRLGLGEVSALLGDAALQTDMETRGSAMTWIADRMLVEADPATLDLYRWFAEGVNAYIEAVRAGELPPPSEYQLAAGLLGAGAPIDLMQPFDERSMVGITATILYNLGYETGDVGREQALAAAGTLFAGAPLEAARTAGVFPDVIERVEPVFPISSAAGWGLDTTSSPPAGRRSRAGAAKPVPASLLEAVTSRNDRLEGRLGHDWRDGFGSNAWAVTADASSDGRAWLAGDGHLPLSVPSLFYQIHLDTALMGGDLAQIGLVIPGMPILAVGTNGHVAWSQTQLMGDITDWYREEVQLDASGEPAATWFDGAWQPVHRHEESYVIADVPVLDSEGRTESWARWVTFDGRWIAGIEGWPADPDDTPGPGQAVVNVRGDWVIPGDVDNDGVVTAISFDYVGLDLTDLMQPIDRFGHAHDVWELRDATRGLLAYSQNIAAADASGSVLYTGYQAVPCRSYLPRDGDNRWIEGADPSRLLDGTRYGGFTIPTRADGTVDESQAADPYRCIVPFEDYPQAIDPADGYVQTANNDPGNITTDGSMFDDPWYIGGPWIEGYRAQRITELLEQAIAEGWAHEQGMADIQGDHHSMLGEQLAPELLAAVAHARALSEQDFVEPGSSEERIATLYLQAAEQIDEAESRLSAWADAGYPARSGVETFYSAVEPGDLDSAVATSIFNAWIGRYVQSVVDDEGMGGLYEPTGATGRLRLLTLMLEGRGAGNPLGLGSWDATLEESAYFDIRHTPEVETSHEVAMLALDAALAFLESPRVDRGVGGYGTADMDAWLWGLRHQVRFESVLADFIGNDPTFSFLTDQFSITPDLLPLADGVSLGDPRYGLPGFPRHGDHLNVDAANSGLNGERFSYGSGPVFRMVIGLGPDGVVGRNVIPGGQSGLNDSPFYADQAELWLANDTLPLRFTLDEVIEGATHRETFGP